MTRDEAITKMSVHLEPATREHAVELLDLIEPYIRARQANALEWAAEQHQRVSASKLRRWAGLLADGLASIQPWAEIAPILEAEKCWWCYGLIYWNAGAWHHVGGDEECCPDPHPIPEEATA